MFYRGYIVDPSISTHGEPIGGVKGFLKSMQKIVRETTPDEVIICWDGEGGSLRRKGINKNYKQGRKPIRLNRNVRNLTEDEEMQNKVWQHIKIIEYLNELPVIQICMPGMEADDIIAVVNEYRATNPTLIISSDKDFIQLQKFQGLEQWSPLTKDFVRGNPEESLWEKCIKGDVGDGVPNILSSDDTLITEGKRQRPISKKKLELWKTDRSTWTDEMHRNFNRNETMVDLSKTPESIRINIINQYKEQTPQHGRLMEYFVEKRLKNLMEHIEEFE